MKGLFGWIVCIGAMALGTCFAQAEDAPAHRRTLKTRDTVLVAGDSFVARSAFATQVGAGVLRVRAGEQIRTYSASWDGAIVADGAAEAGKGRNESAALWVPRITLTTRPTVLVMAFGWDDALRRGGPEGEAFERAYEEGLEMVVKSVRHRVRELFLVTPPADGPEGSLTDRERARLASAAAATVRVAGRLEATLVSLHEGAPREGIAATWEASSGARFEGAPSVVAASWTLRSMGFGAEELSRVGWSPCPEPVFERARDHLALEVKPNVDEVSRTFRVSQALRAYDSDFELLWREMEMRLSVTNEHREDMLLWQRIEVERGWTGVERIVNSTEEVDTGR